MQTLISKVRPAILATALSLALTGTASAQMAVFRIEDPVPNELKGRVADLIRSERPEDAEAALKAVKIKDNSLYRNGGILFIRIESGCREYTCMTIIAKVTSHAIVPQAILRSGPTIRASDEIENVWGVNSSVFIFEGSGGHELEVYARGDRWVVNACPQCLHSHIRMSP